MTLTGTIRFVLTRSRVCNRPFQSAGLGEASGGGSAVFCVTECLAALGLVNPSLIYRLKLHPSGRGS